MAIKQAETLSRADFDEAVVRLRANVSEIAKATGVPRTYLSEFRNGDRKLRPEHLAKLRDFFEGQGVEFEDASATSGTEEAKGGANALHRSLSVGTVCYFPVRHDLSDEQIRDALSEIDKNDERIAALLESTETRGFAMFGKGEISEATQEAIRELFARAAANYLLMRYVTGTDNPIAQPPKQKTLGAILFDTLRQSLQRAGINVEEQPEGAEQSEDIPETEDA